MQPVYLICGVSGSGKSWVCKQLEHKFEYVPHDQHIDDHCHVVAEVARIAKKPVITECPFGERLVRQDLERRHLLVLPYFVIEKPSVVKERFEKRENREIRKNVLTHAQTIVKRAIEWQAPYGTSDWVLAALKAI